MPRVKDIVDEALEIAFEKLGVEALVRYNIMLTVLRKTKNSQYYNRFLNIIDPVELANKKRLSTLKANQISINLSLLSDFELEIVRIVCRINKVSIEDFVLNKRRRELVDARFSVAAILIIQFKYTFQRVGSLLGGKDHSTMIHGVRKHRDFYETIAEYKRKYDESIYAVEEYRLKFSEPSVPPNIVIESLENRKKRTLKNAKTN